MQISSGSRCECGGRSNVWEPECLLHIDKVKCQLNTQFSPLRFWFVGSLITPNRYTGFWPQNETKLSTETSAVWSLTNKTIFCFSLFYIIINLVPFVLFIGENKQFKDVISDCEIICIFLTIASHFIYDAAYKWVINIGVYFWYFIIHI